MSSPSRGREKQGILRMFEKFRGRKGLNTLTSDLWGKRNDINISKENRSSREINNSINLTLESEESRNKISDIS